MKFSITRKGLPLASFESGVLSIEHGIGLLFQTRSSHDCKLSISGEWWEGKWDRGLFLPSPSPRSSQLSLIVNSVIPQKSDRQQLGTRQFCKSALYGVKQNDWRTADTNLFSRRFDWPVYPKNDFGANLECLSDPLSQ